jgi:hypothetical protein
MRVVCQPRWVRLSATAWQWGRQRESRWEKMRTQTHLYEEADTSNVDEATSIANEPLGDRQLS